MNIIIGNSLEYDMEEQEIVDFLGRKLGDASAYQQVYESVKT
jgi:hypothetical protein